MVIRSEISYFTIVKFFSCVNTEMNDDRKKCEAQFLPFRYFYVKLGRKIVRRIIPWDLTNLIKRMHLKVT